MNTDVSSAGAPFRLASESVKDATKAPRRDQSCVVPCNPLRLIRFGRIVVPYVRQVLFCQGLRDDVLIAGHTSGVVVGAQ